MAGGLSLKPMQENFISIKPKHPTLAPHIDYYYFHNVVNEGEAYNVVYYPHYQTVINFYKNAKVTWNEQGRIIQEINENTSECLFTCNPKTSRQVCIKGSVHKIGIVFNPLGINHFIKGNIAQISDQAITPFPYFGADFEDLSTQLYGELKIEEKQALLDQFFVEKYLGFEDQGFRNLVYRMINSEPNLLVNKMAEELKISRKTLLRKFKNRLGTSPSEFKSLVKFRNALHQYDTNLKLTSIAYDSNYYDQSHFIKSYQSLVGKSPKNLFLSLTKLGENRTLWTKMQ